MSDRMKQIILATAMADLPTASALPAEIPEPHELENGLIMRPSDIGKTVDPQVIEEMAGFIQATPPSN